VTFYSAAITLFLVMDPLGNIPVFVSVLSHMDPARRRRVIVREMLIALGILTLFLFFGGYILEGLHVSGPALSIGGGIVLFLIAIRMIFPRREPAAAANGEDQEPLLVPLAVPLVAGPSSMATVILLATQHTGAMLQWFLALLIAWFASFLILLSSDWLRRYLGRRVLTAVERLMGMILITVAVEMLLGGIKDYLPGI
jgi:multiple antibiotic resistance protein